MTLQLLIATVNGQFFKRGYVPPFDNYLVINQVDRPGQPTGGGGGGGMCFIIRRRACREAGTGRCNMRPPTFA